MRPYKVKKEAFTGVFVQPYLFT